MARYAVVESGKVTNMIMADGSLLPAGTWIPVETDSGNIYMKLFCQKKTSANAGAMMRSV